ncbi:MAG: M15 family metallopeptidase [Candidatus Saccharimonadaceae bacterium]
MNIKRRKSYRVVALVIVTTCLIVGAGAWYYLNSQPKTTQQPVAKKTTEEPEKPKAVTIKLPNTAEIPALKQDYAKDSSLWRVVGKKYPLDDAHYVPEGLTLATVASRTDKSQLERSMRSDIMPEIEKLFNAAKAEGYDLMIGSCYRSYEQQNIYFSNYSRLYCQAEAETFSAHPGESEHQTGLSMDIAYVDRHCYIDQCFADTPAGKWLAENAFKYGFILRYPKGEQTDFIFEPWHYRYVGVDLAGALHSSGLTLDEAKPYLDAALVELHLPNSIK